MSEIEHQQYVHKVTCVRSEHLISFVGKFRLSWHVSSSSGRAPSRNLSPPISPVAYFATRIQTTGVIEQFTCAFYCVDKAALVLVFRVVEECFAARAVRLSFFRINHDDFALFTSFLVLLLLLRTDSSILSIGKASLGSIVTQTAILTLLQALLMFTKESFQTKNIFRDARLVGKLTLTAGVGYLKEVHDRPRTHAYSIRRIFCGGSE